MPSSVDKSTAGTDRVVEVLREVTELVREYYELTDRPLGSPARSPSSRRCAWSPTSVGATASAGLRRDAQARTSR